MPYKDPIKQKEAQRRWYEKNSDKVKASVTSGRITNAKKIRALKESGSCVDCGGRFHFSVMDYDHTDDNKVMTVSRLSARRSWAEVLREIEKCDLVCSNCHRYRTWRRSMNLDIV